MKYELTVTVHGLDDPDELPEPDLDPGIIKRAVGWVAGRLFFTIERGEWTQVDEGIRQTATYDPGWLSVLTSVVPTTEMEALWERQHEEALGHPVTIEVREQP